MKSFTPQSGLNRPMLWIFRTQTYCSVSNNLVRSCALTDALSVIRQCSCPFATPFSPQCDDRQVQRFGMHRRHPAHWERLGHPLLRVRRLTCGAAMPSHACPRSRLVSTDVASDDCFRLLDMTRWLAYPVKKVWRVSTNCNSNGFPSIVVGGISCDLLDWLLSVDDLPRLRVLASWN